MGSIIFFIYTNLELRNHVLVQYIYKLYTIYTVHYHTHTHTHTYVFNFYCHVCHDGDYFE